MYNIIFSFFLLQYPDYLLNTHGEHSDGINPILYLLSKNASSLDCIIYEYNY